MSPSRYVKQPRVGDVLDTGRYGMATVLEVHAHGAVLVVEAAGRRRERLERAVSGHWVRLWTADGTPIVAREAVPS